MSRLTWIRSDVLALACRPSRARRATCSRWHVAPRGDSERHARLGMSLRMRVKCDMGRLAVSLLRSSKATFTLLLVAPRPESLIPAPYSSSVSFSTGATAALRQTRWALGVLQALNACRAVVAPRHAVRSGTGTIGVTCARNTSVSRARGCRCAGAVRGADALNALLSRRVAEALRRGTVGRGVAADAHARAGVADRRAILALLVARASRVARVIRRPARGGGAHAAVAARFALDAQTLHAEA